MSESQEMTLKEWVDELPEFHSAHIEYYANNTLIDTQQNHVEELITDLTTLQAEHKALVDGVNGLVDKWREESKNSSETEANFYFKKIFKICTNELQALIKGESGL